MLLALPQRRTDAERREDNKAELEVLQAIETGSSPQVDRTLLRELLHRSPGLLPNLLDPTEVHNYQSALAGISAYKHRVQAIRCEYLHVRIQNEELEKQLMQSRGEIERLQRHVEYLDAIIHQMQASRGWKLVEKCSRLRQTVSQRVERLLGLAKTE